MEGKSVKMIKLIDNMCARIRRRARKPFAADSARHVLTLSLGNLVAQAITIGAIPILSRIYGPAAYGFLAIYVSIATSVMVIATGRYEFAIILPRSPRNSFALKWLARLGLWATSIVFELTILMFITPISALLNVTTHQYWLATLPLHVVFLGELSIQNIWHTRQKSFKTLGYSRVLLSGTMVISQTLLGWLVANDIRGLICGLLIAQLCSIIFLRVRDRSARHNHRSVDPKRVWVMMKQYKKMPLLNAPTALADNARTLGTNLVIGGISQRALGQYSMALRSVQAPLGLLGSALGQVYFQRMSQEARGKLFPLITSILVRLALLTLPLFVALFLALPWLLPMLLGREWYDAGLYAQALVPWLYLNLVLSPVPLIFVVTGTQGRHAIFGVAYAAVPILALLLFRNDLYVAIWVLGISMAAMLIVLLILALHTARFDDRIFRATEFQGN